MSSLLDVVVGRRLMISRHAEERWEQRFPGKCMIEAMLNACRIRSIKADLWGINPMTATYYYDRESRALFVACLDRRVILTVVLKTPKAKRHLSC